MKQQIADTAALAGAKATPAIAVASATLMGYALDHWVLVLTVLYLLLQIGHLVWRWMREWTRGKDDDE